MYNLLVRDVMDRDKALTLSSRVTASAAAKLMAKRNIGAVLVGIFTERDALFRVIVRDLDARSTRLADVMTANPRAIDPSKSYGRALVMTQEYGFRHAPVIENGKPIGIVSSRNAMDPELGELASEERRRKVLREEH